jgi:very-short-patch-repair endonuclease/DNA polymerase III delta prime subunit
MMTDPVTNDDSSPAEDDEQTRPPAPQDASVPTAEAEADVQGEAEETRPEPPLTVVIEYDRVVNFGLQQNHVELVKRIRLTNEGEGEVEAIEVSLAIENDTAERQTLRIDRLASGATYNIESLSLRLDPAILRAKVEREETQLILEVTSANFAKKKERHPLSILAHNEWPGLSVLPEIIGAFVLPNDPHVADLVSRARALLRESTGDGTMSGYQEKSRERVRQVARAIFETLVRDRIGYLGAPPSFEQEGQKVRFPERIFAHKQANCLDVSLLLAAAFEAAGLHPFIVLTHGHAFVGYWTVDTCFADPAIPDAALVINRFELAALQVIEGTLALKDDPPTFEHAVAAAREKLGQVEEFDCLLDIRAARKLGIRAIQLDGESSPARPAKGPLRSFELDEVAEFAKAPPKGAEDALETARSRIDVWKSKLLDLTLRNRFLNFRPSKKNAAIFAFDLEALEDALAEQRKLTLVERPKIAEEALRNLEAHEEETGENVLESYLRDSFENDMLHVDLVGKEFETTLTSIYREAKNGLEESGANTLYLALGFLRWFETETSEEARRAPVILLPVNLIRTRVGGEFRIEASGADVRINVTLLEKLKTDFNLDTSGLEVAYEDSSDDGIGISVRRILAGFRAAIVNQPRWLIDNDAALSILAFSKVTMWEDLEQNAETLMQSEVIEHLVERSTAAFDQDDLPDHRDMDRDFAAEEVFCPLDADSSQLAAVAASRRGRTFVLQGPPGTGKSQTITNMIAQAIGEGKRVLFVAEKRAALEVVQSRLEKVGLGTFCLEVHSNKANKKDVLRQLGESLEMSRRQSPAEWEAQTRRLEELRAGLNHYAALIHHEHPIGYSVFRATSELIGLKDAEVLKARPDRVRELAQDADALPNLFDFAGRFATALESVEPTTSHRLRYAGRSEFSPRLAQQIEDRRRALAAAAEKLEKAWSPLRVVIAAPARASRAFLGEAVEALSEVAASPGPSEKLLRTGEWETFWGDFVELMSAKDERDALRSELMADYREEFLDLDPLPLISEAEEAEQAWFVPAWFKKRALAKKVGVYRLGGKPDFNALRADLESLLKVRRRAKEMGDPSHVAPEMLGARWRKGEGDSGDLRTLVSWTKDFRQRLARLREHPEGEAIREAFIGLATADRERIAPGTPLHEQLETLREAREGVVQEMEALRVLLDLDTVGAFGEEDRASFAEVAEFAAGLNCERSDISDWCHWRKVREEAEARGLDDLVRRADAGLVAAHQVGTAVRRSILQEWLMQTLEADDLLRDFNTKEHERKIDEFRRIDREIIRLASAVITAKASAAIPKPSANTPSSSEVGVLMRELNKKSRHMPLRRLFERVQTVLPRLKPCLLMSPLSVAQFLDPKKFKADLVIFDEASQIPVWDAIGAMARGEAAIVVGDSKQLPPTSFFSRNLDDPEDVGLDGVTDAESILDECEAARLPVSRLLWHYRSRHEELIAFSNFHYYDNELLTFPSALAESDSLGVSFRHIADGIYDRGKSATNQKEAEAIVEEVKRHCLAPGNPKDKASLGIVAFSAAQQGRIEDLLDQARRDHREIEDYFVEGAVEEPIFVKNLENVQGDERDHILFSICYGRDAAGRFLMNLGPLNKPGGERRLNVVITRARRSVTVFSSIRADAIDLSRTRALGVQHLKTFLDYAERGPRAIAEASAAIPGADFDSPFEKDVCEALRRAGHEVDLQVGCSGYRIDLAIRHPERPGRYVLGIECDGAAYHSAASARDRDRLRQSVLENLGWTIHRVWSTDWWNDAARELEKLEEAIADAMRKVEVADAPRVSAAPGLVIDAGVAGVAGVDGEASDVDSDSDSNSAEAEASSESGTEPDAETATDREGNEDPAAPDASTFQSSVAEATSPASSEVELSSRRRDYPACADDPDLGSADDFYASSNRGALARRLREIVEEEGPVHRGRAYRRLASSWQLQSLTRRLSGHLDAIVASSDLHLLGEFLWAEGQNPAELSIYRVSDDGRPNPRKTEEIPDEEIANAALDLLEGAIALPTEELARLTARAFGIGRLGQKVEAKMRRGLDLLATRGRAEYVGEETRLLG